MLNHYSNIGSASSGSSFKDRKSKRGALTVTDAEVQAAMPRTRLQLREQLVDKGELRKRSSDFHQYEATRASQVDLRYSTSRSTPATKVGSNLSEYGCVETSLPSFMSDKQLSRLANDPIASLKYGGAIKDFARNGENFNEMEKRRREKMEARIEQRSHSICIDNRNLDRIENRMRNMVVEDDYENYYDAQHTQV